jgi:hypothetical protein
MCRPARHGVAATVRFPRSRSQPAASARTGLGRARRHSERRKQLRSEGVGAPGFAARALRRQPSAKTSGRLARSSASPAFVESLKSWYDPTTLPCQRMSRLIPSRRGVFAPEDRASDYGQAVALNHARTLPGPPRQTARSDLGVCARRAPRCRCVRRLRRGARRRSPHERFRD